MDTPCLSIPVETARMTGENVKFSKFSEVRRRSKFSTGNPTKHTGNDVKNQRGELTNILRRFKNIVT